MTLVQAGTAVIIGFAACIAVAVALTMTKPSPKGDRIVPHSQMPAPSIQAVKKTPPAPVIIAPPIISTEAPPAVLEPQAEARQPVAEPEPAAPVDVCAKTGGRKIWIDGGRKWHCIYDHRRRARR